MYRKLLSPICLLFSLAIPAAIIIENQSLLIDTDNVSPYSSFSLVDETNAIQNSMLLVSLTGEGDTTSGVTIDWSGGMGVAANVMVEEEAGSPYTGIYLFDLGDVSSETITIHLPIVGQVDRERVSILQLSGGDIDSVISNTGRVTNKSTTGKTTLADVEDGSFVFSVGSTRKNGRNLVATAGNSDAAAWQGNGDGRGHGYMWDLDSAAGTRDAGFTLSGDTDGMSISAVSIAAIPEPGTLALLGVAGLALGLMRRRR